MKKSSYVTFYGFDQNVKVENRAKVSYDPETGLSCFTVIKKQTPITLVDAIAIIASEFKEEKTNQKDVWCKIDWNVEREFSKDVEDWVHIENETSKETTSFNLKEPVPDVYEIPLIYAKEITRLIFRGSDEFLEYKSSSTN